MTLLLLSGSRCCRKVSKSSFNCRFVHQTSFRNSGAKRDFFRLLRLAQNDKAKLAGGVGLLVISSTVSMSVPFAFGHLIDIISGKRSAEEGEEAKARHKSGFEEHLKTLSLLLIGVFTIGAVSNFGRVYLMRMASNNITARLRNSVYGSVMRQEIAFFDQTKTGELVNRLSADSLLVSQAITQQISDGLRSGFMTMAGVGMMFYMSPQLALVSLAVVPPVAIWAVFMGKKVKSTGKEVQNALADASQLAEEKISNIRTVKTFAKELNETRLFQQQMDTVLHKSAKEAMIHAKFYGMTGLSGNMIILSVLYYGGHLVSNDVISVGHLTSFILYAAYVGIGLSGVSTFFAEMMKALGASSRLWQLIDRPPLIPISGGLIPDQPLVGNIRFREVHFAYPSRPDASILRGLDLDIPTQKVTAVVGSSGSGKSTLASLLLRMYEADQGAITIDGHDIRDLDPLWLKQQIGTVSQEPILFSASITDNIAYGAHDPASLTHEAIIQAAKEANAHDFISAFPDGYETLVGERGIMLSGGQKQRVAIARAILNNPRIIILDEATSALDSASEMQVKEAIERLIRGRCVITIAHRLSTIQNADQIVVLHEGRIAEKGTYSQLLSLEEGIFRKLVLK